MARTKQPKAKQPVKHKVSSMKTQNGLVEIRMTETEVGLKVEVEYFKKGLIIVDDIFWSDVS